MTLVFAVFGLLWRVAIWWEIAAGAFLVFMALAWSQTGAAIRRAELGLQDWREHAPGVAREGDERA